MSVSPFPSFSYGFRLWAGDIVPILGRWRCFNKVRGSKNRINNRRSDCLRPLILSSLQLYRVVRHKYRPMPYHFGHLLMYKVAYLIGRIFGISFLYLFSNTRTCVHTPLTKSKEPEVEGRVLVKFYTSSFGSEFNRVRTPKLNRFL